MADTDLLDYAGLRHYDSKLKDHIQDELNDYDTEIKGHIQDELDELWNWQKTEKAGTVAFKPAPESDLEPVVDFMFTETPPASGDKSPSNPSTITGVFSVGVGRCGKNLFGPFPSSFTVGGVAVTVDSNGVFTLNGTCNVSAMGQRQYVVRNSVLQNFYMPEGTFVALSMQDISGTSTKTASAAYSVRVQIETKPKAGSFGYNYVDADDLTATPGVYNRSINGVMIVVSEGSSFTDYKFKVQLEIGNTATSFETYFGNEYTISLGDTYYGGSLDVATGVMTVTQIGYELDSSLDWNTTTGTYAYRTSKSPAASIVAQNIDLFKSSHFNLSTANVANMPANTFFPRSDGNVIVSTDGLSMQAFKDWLDAQKLAETPVVVTYPLYTPYTLQLTPTQIRSLPALDKYEPRINTVYTDQEAVQVGYQRYADTMTIVHNDRDNTIKTYSFAHRNVDNASLTFSGGSSITKGARLALNGSASSTNPSCFSLVANDDGTNYKSLVGSNAGNLTWNGQPLQTSSDERVKTALSTVPDDVLDAWEDVNWGQFQYLEAVQQKGEESARLHLGLIAQHVMSVFEQHGLDVCDYGILCHEEHPAVDEEETVVDAEAYVDEEGVEHPAVTHVETRHVQDAVDLWMVRYAEAQAMEACCMRRENARLKKRIADLEDRLAALEAKLS